MVISEGRDGSVFTAKTPCLERTLTALAKKSVCRREGQVKKEEREGEACAGQRTRGGLMSQWEMNRGERWSAESPAQYPLVCPISPTPQTYRTRTLPGKKLSSVATPS